MASITLHRADRILMAIKAALKIAEPKPSTTLSVFASDVNAEISERQRALVEGIKTTARLLAIRAALKGLQQQANATCGVASLLARKQAADDLVTSLERMPGVAAEPDAEPEDPYGLRRRRKKTPPPAILNLAAAVAMAEASRDRFRGADGTVATDIEIGLVDAAMAADFRQQAVTARRQADELSDSLREMNASVRIEFGDADMDWLTAHNVV